MSHPDLLPPTSHNTPPALIDEPVEEMSFLGHLEVLRKHIIRAVIVVVVLMIVGFYYSTWITDNILLVFNNVDFVTYRWLNEAGNEWGIESLKIDKINFVVQNRQMAGQFNASISIAIWTGLIVGFPYIVWELWRFIRPALYNKEQRAIRGFVFYLSALFFIGIGFGYYVLCPMSIQFLASYQISATIKNEIDFNSLMGTVLTTTLSTGLVFELPLVAYFLAKIGIITDKFLSAYRRHAIVVIFIVAAVITPPDAITQILVAIPLILLYEVSIMVTKRTKAL